MLDEIPEHMRKVTNEANPILLSDSDEEIEMIGPSSSASRPASQSTRPLFRSGSGMNDDAANAFNMMMAERSEFR